MAPREYYDFIKKADSLYDAGDYQNSALAYSSAFSTFRWKGFQDDRYNAARAWTMAHNSDSAFFNLERIVSRIGFADYDRLTTDSALSPLRNDELWKYLMEKVTINMVLDSMVKEDQKWRGMITKINNGEAGSVTMTDASHNVMMVDSLNYPIEKNLFKKHEFIVVSHNFWLLVQHADRHPDFQQAVLDKMKTELDKGNASPNDYAYLTDRVKANTGQLQMYGTQMQLNADSTSFEPKPCFEPDKLNERRKSMQLSTIEDYIQAMNNRYHGGLKKN